MDNPINKISESFACSAQLSVADITELADLGYKSIICNRPDGEGGAEQPTQQSLADAAHQLGLQFAYLPVVPGQITEVHGIEFAHLLNTLPSPIMAFCRTGNRAKTLYQMAQNSSQKTQHDVTNACNWSSAFDVVIVGGGSAGIGLCASLLKRRSDLRIAIIEPSDTHYYQPAWTLVGAGAFQSERSIRPMQTVIPKQAEWIQASAASFNPEKNQVVLSDGRLVEYHQLVVCPGLRLAWEKIEGLSETLGKHGVTSNYGFKLAPYTWELVQQLKTGKAIFTQPSMPIKCAGAPQKAMYLSASHWRKTGVLDNIDIEFNTAGAVLFGVAAFVPSLMAYVKRYNAQLVFNANLVKVDGPNQRAWFDIKNEAGEVTRVEKTFDLLHVVPAQVAPDFIQQSPLADTNGWCDVDQTTLQHKRYPNIFALGDVVNCPNAKTAAAARKQIVVVAENLLAAKELRPMNTHYDGYGACPLTVEHGKVVMAEFGYGGKLLPTFPLIPTVPRRFAWLLKATVVPWLYWNLMLKGREWLARPSRDEK